jgi:hypothetical protein
VTAKRLSDLIIEHGPYAAGGAMPFPTAPNGHPIITAAQINELRDELIELRYARTAAAEVHQQHEGRCAECVEWCECGERDLLATCAHGNVLWSCRTAKALGLA